MKRLIPIVLTILLQVVSFSSWAQNNRIQNDKVYGLNPQLYNGKYYSFFLPSDTKRTPFLTDSTFIKGSVTIKGICYRHLSLNYDIYNQQLILPYKTQIGKVQLLIVSEAWLESFTLGNKYFKVINIQFLNRQFVIYTVRDS